jgi:alpha-amylase
MVSMQLSHTTCRCADEQVDGVYNKYRDDVTHTGKRIDWGKWAITGNDPQFGGTGNPDTGERFE